LVRGNPVTLEDGRVVEPDVVLGPPQAGLHFVHVGDCGSTDNLVDICSGADALVIEATYLEYETSMAKQFGHLTARQAAELAKEAQVGHLYLTHISRRYRERQILEEAQSVFPRVTVARDFDQFEIRRIGSKG
jgi:ribonuclease Z